MQERTSSNRLLELGIAAGIVAIILFSILAWVQEGDRTFAGVGAGFGFGILLFSLIAALRR